MASYVILIESIQRANKQLVAIHCERTYISRHRCPCVAKGITRNVVHQQSAISPNVNRVALNRHTVHLRPCVGIFGRVRVSCIAVE